ncbi:MAG: AmmeMemoRadiSam system radical SAM enzyme [Clostridia bacterium]
MEAMYYKSLKEGLQCQLCPHGCILKDGDIGICKVRKNDNDKLISLSYQQISSIALDPIEKKPLRMFLPNTNVLSVGSYGCNLKCPWCQNYSISQEKPLSLTEIESDTLVEIAVKKGYPSIAFTYNEPIVNYEFMLETAQLAKQKGVKMVLVTAGYINKEPWIKLLDYIDALNIDLKGYNSRKYRQVLGADLTTIKDNIIAAYERAHIELATLVVPGFNDDLEELESMFSWIARIDTKIPLHLARYFPRYQYNKSSPKIEFMYQVRDLANKYLKNVFLGNM